MSRCVGKLVLLLVLLVVPIMMVPITAMAQQTEAPMKAALPMGGHDMAGHMYITALRPLKPGDQQRADAVAAAAKQAMAPYTDYKKALADGYEIFLPDLPQPQYHFTRHDYGREAWTHFDPSKPTSLLYNKNADGNYTLIGAMYTDRVDATEDELDSRIPLSIAHWHQHINFCKAPASRKREYFGPDAKFGLLGSITTQQACEAEGGEFHPHLFGWMVHVYPYETDPKKVWAVDDDDMGHDNMDHSALPGMAPPMQPGMKMN
jgi:hypothetical protein